MWNCPENLSFWAWKPVLTDRGQGNSVRANANPALAAGFFCFRKKQCGCAGSFPLRFRHSAPDNAVHRPTTVEDRRKPRNLLECYHYVR
jgi:hypothetical protein